MYIKPIELTDEEIEKAERPLIPHKAKIRILAIPSFFS